MWGSNVPVSEILKFAPKLAETAGGIKTNEFIGVMSNIVPKSLGEFYIQLFKEQIVPKYDRLHWSSPKMIQKDGALDETGEFERCHKKFSAELVGQYMR